ncbi:MAG: TolC family protein [Gammaproteobacteria bacterium]|nr:TolC family protein [Gammaproteobacteria bacterium]MDH5803211.1 TolC family protein [Gammaproteobacteria bacterium]
MSLRTIVLAGVFAASGTAQAADMTLEQVLQAVVHHYPALKTASYQVEKAYQNAIKVKSRLGWQLQAQAGLAKDLSFFGDSVQRLELGGGVQRQLQSGGELSVSGGYQREDSDSPLQPNPLNSNRVDLNYRRPLQQGAGAPDYALDLKDADLSVDLAKADRQVKYDTIAERVIAVFFDAVATKSRMDNMNLALQRTQRLEQFTRSRLNLGIAENKDRLQVVAQLDSQQAQMKILELAWVQQLITLNRLMGRGWDDVLNLAYTDKVSLSELDFSAITDQVKQYSPTLHLVDTRLESVENIITRQQEVRKDRMDLVLHLGNQMSKGSTPLGERDSSELLGGVSVEYRSGLDKSGLDAAIRQSQYEHGAIKEQRKQVLEDLHYGTAALLAQIKAIRESLQAFENSAASERKKLDDADRRYRKGRIDIDRVIQFENQLATAELNVVLQRLEFIRGMYQLYLLRGSIWKNIELPKLDLS